jgi:hypothetical protein
MDIKRQERLRVGREAAALTIPSLLPPEGHSQNQVLVRPKQSLGAALVNSLSSKMILALFPTNTPFFKFQLTRETKDEIGEQQTEAQEILARVESEIVSNLEKSNYRAAMVLVFAYLIIIGDSCVRIDKEGNFRSYRLDSYVVERDSIGTVIDVIVKEKISPLTLPKETLESHFLPEEIVEFSKSREKEVSLFTRMYLEDKKYKVIQELNGKPVEGSEGSYPLDEPEFIVSRWKYIPGEDYGRGMIEDYISDLTAFDDYSRDLSLASSAAAKVIFALKYGSTITKRQLATAESGDILEGNAEDVGTIGLDKLQDFSITKEAREEIKRDLSRIFLMNSSVQRNGERVTAEEIRYLAQELEDALGGVYSVLSQELQRPFLKRYISVLNKMKKIPKLPKDGVDQQITTGLEALGRGHEVNKLLTFLQQLGATIGEQQLAQRINSGEVAKQLALGMGVDATNLIKTEEQVQQDIQQQMTQQMAQDTVPGAINESIKQQGAING